MREVERFIQEWTTDPIGGKEIFIRFYKWLSGKEDVKIDFNARPGGDVYRTFVGDEESNDPLLLKDSIAGGRGIDWVLYKGNANVLHYENVNYNVDGVYPSDHKPVFVEFHILDK